MSGIQFFLCFVFWWCHQMCIFQNLCNVHVMWHWHIYSCVSWQMCIFQKLSNVHVMWHWHIYSCVSWFLFIWFGNVIFWSEMSYFDTLCVLKKVPNNTVILVLFTNQYYGLNNGTDIRYVFFEKLYGIFSLSFLWKLLRSKINRLRITLFTVTLASS